MIDLDFASSDEEALNLEGFRLLRIIGKFGKQFGKLPIRFKYDTVYTDTLIAFKLIERGHSGWPGVPGYRLTTKGTVALMEWLTLNRKRLANDKPTNEIIVTIDRRATV
jgi:hypothetical protein